MVSNGRQNGHQLYSDHIAAMSNIHDKHSSKRVRGRNDDDGDDDHENATEHELKSLDGNGDKKHATKKQKEAQIQSDGSQKDQEARLFLPHEDEKQQQQQQQQQKRQKQHQQSQYQDRRSELAKMRQELPVYKYKAQIIDAIANHDVLLVMASTGSGKSTQIPAYLDEAAKLLHRKSRTNNDNNNNNNNNHRSTSSSFGTSICVTQPRRVAAMTVARRVAEERGCVLGTAVGYRVRFDDCSSKGGGIGGGGGGGGGGGKRTTTRILYATDGMLLREAMTDPLLCRYHIVVLDESHERSLQTDILFGVVRRAMRARNGEMDRTGVDMEQNVDNDNGVVDGANDADSETPDQRIQRRMQKKARRLDLPPLKVVVMSATLQVETFQAFFPKAVTMEIPGRLYPVQIVYAKENDDDYIDSALAVALQIHFDMADDGDILIFLPGQEEIEDLHQLLKRHLQDQLQNILLPGSESQTSTDIVQDVQGLGTNLTNDGRGSNTGRGAAATIIDGVMICVLYAALPPEAQMLAFAPKPMGCRRKIILATNIAETSVTLDGIRYVVDCGKHKTRDFSTTTGMESLTVQDISQAQAAQRTGRAGRVSAGLCFRLYTEDIFESMAKVATPEIARVNLAQVVLMLKGMGIHDPNQFDYLTRPSTVSLKQATKQLFAFGALGDDMELTEHGKRMAKLPVDPVYSHLLLQSPKYGCTHEMLTVVAMLSAENVLYRPGGGYGGEEGGGNGLAQKASQAHKRFKSYEGDIPTLLNIYELWRREAIYNPPGQDFSRKQQSDGKLPHGQWCARNFVSGRALARAYSVRQQLASICSKSLESGGLGMNVYTSCKEDQIAFLKCACAGLFLQAASRIPAANYEETNGRRHGHNSGQLGLSRGKYKTKISGDEASIHPTSALFMRSTVAKTVVYTELLVTKRTYIRGVTQIKEEWLAEVAPHFYG